MLASLCLLVPIVLLLGLIVYLPIPYQGFEFSRDVVGQIDANGPAAKAGLRLGDNVIAINGKPVANWDGPYMAPGDSDAVYTVERDGLRQNVIVRFGPGSPETQ